MKIGQIAGKWAARLISAGGAMLLAACYGPARPDQRSVPVKHVRGVVKLGDRPVAKAVVCESGDPQRCPLTQEDGQFELRFEADGKNHEVCAKPYDGSVGFVPNCVTVPGDTQFQEITITVNPVNP